MMGKWKLVVFFLLLAVNTYAQQVGTKTPYIYSHEKYTQAPVGFKPVFVNYVGRHGARFLTKAGSDIRLLEVLTQAEKAHALTAKGVLLKAMLIQFLSIEKNNYENISLLGEKEQSDIGARMYHQYANAFKGHGIAVQITHKVRTRQSADAFLRSFATYSGKKEYMLARDSEEHVLRFYDLSPAYQQYKKSTNLQLDSLEKDPRTAATAARVCAQIFSGSFKVDAVSVTENIYDLYSVQFSIPLEMQQKGYHINFGIVLSKKDLQWLSFKNGAADFLEKGPAKDTLGIQVKIAVPLLVDFLNSTDTAIQSPSRLDANLRFTHAEAISPFATLLGIPVASVPAASVYSYNKHWQASTVIPLSANIQWIIYSNDSEYLVKVLLNEKEVSLPLKTSTYPYYKWEDVRMYYLEKLKSLHVEVGDDMHRYLLQVK